MRLQLFAFLAAMVILAAPVFADALADELSDYNFGLDASIVVPNKTFDKSPQLLTVSITATNPSQNYMPVYVLRKNFEGKWEVLKLLGSLAPKDSTKLQLEVELRYDKVAKKKTEYLIVGRAENGELYGAKFEIPEDWSSYEKNVGDSITSAITGFVPVVGILLAVLILLMAQAAYSNKSQGVFTGEYTVRSLFFPNFEGRPFEEKIADIMIHPAFMAFELACVAILVLVMFGEVTRAAGVDQGIKIMLLAGVGAITVPFAYFAAAWYFEKREEGKPLRFFAGMFVWGMFAAFLSLLISSGFVAELSGAGIVPYAVIVTILVSPIVEEILKGTGVLFMSGHHEYNDTLTGLLLGFTVGAGFAFVENWFYFAFRSNPYDVTLGGWLMLIAYRSFFNTLAHGCFTAAVSTAIGYLRSVDALKQFARLAFAPGVFMAVMLHVIFNLTALADSYAIASREMPFFIFNPTLIILLAAMFFLVLVLAVIDEKKRKIKKLDTSAFQMIGMMGTGKRQ
ncbi:MAG: PrsW family intramembrane metalloprotease [Candidatus Anstonellaceae archaeon]